MAYYQFRDSQGNGYGSCEVFFMSEFEIIGYGWVKQTDDGFVTFEPGTWQENGYIDSPKELEGWYWQACFPGCLPDGEPMGPFSTESEAMEDADILVEV